MQENAFLCRYQYRTHTCDVRVCHGVRDDADVVAVMLQRAPKEPSPTTENAVYAKLLSSVQTLVGTASQADSRTAMPAASHTQMNNNLLAPPYSITPHPHPRSQNASKMLNADADQLCQFPVVAIIFTCTLSVPLTSAAPLPAA